MGHTGKTSVGEAIATACGYRFVEGDALHPEENIRKMSAGIPLTDADRWPWLKEIGRQLASDAPLVVSYSALKRSYRTLLRESAGDPSPLSICMAAAMCLPIGCSAGRAILCPPLSSIRNS